MPHGPNGNLGLGISDGKLAESKSEPFSAKGRICLAKVLTFSHSAIAGVNDDCRL